MNKIEVKNKVQKNFFQKLLSFFNKSKPDLESQSTKFQEIQIPKTPLENIPENIPETLNENIPENIPETLNENIPENIPENIEKNQNSKDLNQDQLASKKIENSIDSNSNEPDLLQLNPKDLKKIINDEFEEVLDDDEINFIVIDGKKMRKKNHKIKNDQKIQEIIDYLIKNNSESYQANQQRNLDRETGGTELPKTFTTSSIDVWDNRGEEIEEMAEIKSQDYNSDDKASMIWEKKRKKKQQNDHENAASNSFESSSSKSRSGIFNSSTSKKSRHL
jgi:uncharacterized membrane protein YheB (UPF0754 family)